MIPDLLGLTLAFVFGVLQMQQQELAQLRQREANLTALAAIGPRKKRKFLDSPSSSSGAEVGHSSFRPSKSISNPQNSIIAYRYFQGNICC